MNQAVFEHFRAIQYSSAHACAEMTGVSPDQVTATMREMARLGHLQQVSGCQGLYLFQPRPSVGAKKPAVPVPEPQRKMWWAMCMPHNNPAPFSAFAVAQLAGCSKEYAQRYIAGLRLRKFVVVANRSLGWNQYRITSAAPAADRPPRINIQLGG